MRMISVAFAFLCASSLPVIAQVAPALYTGYSGGNAVTVDGVINKREWKRVVPERDFVYPWREEQAPATRFYAKVDDGFFYFAFRANDADIVLHDFSKELDVAEGDRVEVFFSADPDLREYYCLEIRPDGKVLDYKASFYRKFDDAWDFVGLEVAAKIHSFGYTVEGRIPLKILEDVGIVAENCFYMGLFRAEYNSSKPVPEVKWISWMKPGSADPDFHIPAAFGQFCTVKNTPDG